MYSVVRRECSADKTNDRLAGGGRHNVMDGGFGILMIERERERVRARERVRVRDSQFSLNGPGPRATIIIYTFSVVVTPVLFIPT